MLSSIGLFFRLGFLERLLTPGIPIHRIVRVLQQIRTGLVDQAIGILVCHRNPELSALSRFERHRTFVTLAGLELHSVAFVDILDLDPRR